MMIFRQEHGSFTNDPEITVKYVIHDDVSLSAVFQEFRKFLMACGYSPEGINEYVEPE